MPALPKVAVRSLTQVADTLVDADDDWWLIGGAAVALHGLPIDIADVDVLMSPRDLARVIARLDIAPVEGAAVDRFRSDTWARWNVPPRSVDLMTGLQIRTGERWTRVDPRTREAIAVDGRAVYVPARQELIDICRLFGRPKDLERAAGLARIG
jgi:hypothetical protein